MTGPVDSPCVFTPPMVLSKNNRSYLISPMSKKLAVLATVLVLTAPSFASAAALTAEQTNAILSLLTSFGADSATVASVSAALGVATTIPTYSCVDIHHNMTLGSRGAEVANLQNYLISLGYLTGTSATGYYGYMTVQAVGKLQVAKSIVSSESDPAYGIIGPKTRRAIACNTVPPPGQKVDFSASPTTTATQLPVTFTGTNVTISSQYIIEYGDGADSGALRARLVGMCPQNSPCSDATISATHAYVGPGIYTATLEPYIACMWSNPRCLMATQSLGQVTITVDSP